MWQMYGLQQHVSFARVIGPGVLQRLVVKERKVDAIARQVASAVGDKIKHHRDPLERGSLFTTGQHRSAPFAASHTLKPSPRALLLI